MKALLSISCMLICVLASGQSYDIEVAEFNTLNSDISIRFWQGKPVITSNYDIDGKSAYTNLFILEGDQLMPFSDKMKNDFHTGPIAFSQNGTFACFSQTLNTTETERMPVGLFFSTFDGTSWSDPESFEHNSENYNNAHPTLSSDGRTLIFSSTRDGGFGKADLYISYLKDGAWSEPQNLGPEINSGFSELFPFLHSDGRLFFSSNATGGLGGLDIFTCEPQDTTWFFPRRLTEPFNSNADDFSYYQSGEGVIYIASSRKSKSKGKDNLYKITAREPKFKEKSATILEAKSLCVTFFENGPETPDSSSLFRYTWHLSDGSTLEGIEVDHCFEKEGVYNVKLTVYDSLLLTSEVVSEIEYEARHFNHDYLKVEYVDSSKNMMALKLVPQNFPTLKCTNAAWRTAEKWIYKRSILVSSDLKSVDLVVYAKDSEGKEIEKFFTISLTGLHDSRSNPK